MWTCDKERGLGKGARQRSRRTLEGVDFVQNLWCIDSVGDSVDVE